MSGNKKVILVSILILSAAFFLSCKDTSESGSKNAVNSSGDSGYTENLLPDLPDAVNMNGKEFKIITAGWYTNTSLLVDDIVSEEITGEPLNDAAFNRQRKIEDTYNCKIAHIEGFDHTQAVDNIRKSVMAADKEYDIAFVRGFNFSSLMASNSLIDLSFIPNVNFDNPWWSGSIYESLVINGKHFAVSGNMSSAEMKAVYLTCFNKEIIQNAGLGSPYEFVKSGDWTLEKMNEMAKSCIRDLNGDGKIAGRDDQWGMIFANDTPPGIVGGAGVKFAGLDESGTPQMAIDSAENIIKLQKIHELLGIGEISEVDYKLSAGTDYLLGVKHLFQINAVHTVNLLRQQEEDFGIVPLPKYDKSQLEYIPTTSGIFTPLICIPKTNDDLENTGIFMEAFAYEGSKSVVPAFYENILKSKMARDDESADMIDYIFGNVTYDIGTLLNFGSLIDNFIVYFREQGNNNFVSFFEKHKPAIERAIAGLIEESIG